VKLKDVELLVGQIKADEAQVFLEP